MQHFTETQDPYGLLQSLFFHLPVKNSPEGLFRILGFVHLYQASGIHLLAFFGLLEWGLERLWMRSGLSIRGVRIVVLLLCSVTGFWIWSLQSYAPSFLRTFASFYIRSFFKNRGATGRVLLPLLFTLFLDWMVHPGGNFLNAGALHFYLSVMGGLLAWEQTRHRSLILQHGGMAIGSWIPIAILDLERHHLVSFMTPIYSLITIPLIADFLYPVTLVFLLFYKTIPDFWCEVWRYFVDLILVLPDWGFTWFSTTTLSGEIAFLFAGVFIFVERWVKTKMIRVSLIILLVPFLFWGRETLAREEIVNRVVQLDVGQGDSALVQSQGRTEMVDLGSDHLVSDQVWFQKLARYGVLHVNGVLFSHLDEDHVGGVYRLLPFLPIDCIETNEALWRSEKGMRLKEWIEFHYPEVRLSSEGCIIQSRVAWFQSHEKGAKGNELMAGIVHELSPSEAYFALGDGDQAQERLYGARFKNEIESHAKRIWKVSHHGSRFSSDERFLWEMDPDQFWISVGRKNSYHHPHPLTLLRLSRFRGAIYRTDVEGDVEASLAE